MHEDEVPQDDSFYEGHVRVIYAVGRDGRYLMAASRGWETERIVTAQAVEQVERRERVVADRVRAGELSPLAWHMARRQMTPRLLAAHCRIWRWRIRRHLRPDVFGRLSRDVLRKYADALGVTVDELRTLPVSPRVDLTAQGGGTGERGRE
jgi:hypothetical protein